MHSQASAWSPRPTQQTQTLIIIGALLVALFSLAFAAFTSRGRGVDLRPLHDIARSWVDGNYNPVLRFNVYPPATAVLLSPIAFLSFNTLSIIWFIFNLALTVLSAGLVAKLIGSAWPWRAKYFLLFFVMTWAPLRVTLRNGQITMVIIALLLGSLVAWRNNRLVLAGVLFGMALCKYTLTFPFIFYFVWHQQWKLIFSAVGFQAAMTGIFAYRLGINFSETIANYFMVATRFSLSFQDGSDLNSLLRGVTGGNELVSILLGFAVVCFALISIVLILKLRPEAINSHLALLSLFALWSIYHRTYDFMLCMIPVAVLIDFVVTGRLLGFSYFWLGVFSLLVIGMPGFLAERVGSWTDSPVGSALIFSMTHSERFLVLAMFSSLLWVLWKRMDQLPEYRPLIPGRSTENLA